MNITARTARSIAATLASAAIFAAAITSAAIPAQASSHARQCRTPDVTVTLTRPVQAAGNEGVTVTIRDNGARSCTLDGYPGLGLLSLAGNPVASVTSDGPTYFAADPGPSLVTLRPGASARAHLAWGNDGTRVHRATFLTVRLPGDGWHKTVMLPDAPADIYRGRLTVTAFARSR